MWDYETMTGFEQSFNMRKYVSGKAQRVGNSDKTFYKIGGIEELVLCFE